MYVIENLNENAKIKS